MIAQLLPTYFPSFLICVFLLVFIQVSNTFSKQVNHLFMTSAVTLLIINITEGLNSYLALAGSFISLQAFLTGFDYFLRPLTGFCFVCISFHGISVKRHLFYQIPVHLNLFFLLATIWNGCVFYYTEDGVFHRGPFNFVPFVIGFFYILLLLHQTAQLAKKNMVLEAVIIGFVGVLAILATFLDVYVGSSSMLSAVMTASLLFYYMFFHANQNNRCPLTGAYIRRRFFQDAQKHQKAMTAVISIDLNNLKTINDNFGHAEGDKAIVALANVVTHLCTPRTVLYRTGGDEFMVLCYHLPESSVEALIARIKEKMDETLYSCAVGYAMTNGLSFDKACNLADSRMYEDKVKMKGEEYRSKYRTSERIHEEE